MSMNVLRKAALTLVAALAFVVSGYAQFTTSTMSGRVIDATGDPLTGAVVVAVHTPSGSQYYAVANNDGYYTINAMRPGGPYEVNVSFVGCNTVQYNDINLALSETYNLDVTLTTSETLEDAVVVASASKFAAEKTGATTNVSNREMMNLPNTSRSIEALTKLSPYSNGMSFAGGDGRSTNFTVDGSNMNQNFGLGDALPGGGTPISLDALEEIQFVVAPFDVRQSNFVGGGINAVTKSGTNTFKGTAYSYYTNQNFRGNVIAGNDLGDRAAASNFVAGATIGGPIIKNKLFFFANIEMTKQPGQCIEYQADAAKQAVLQQISDKLQKEYNYNPGSYTDFPGGTNGLKILARVDWNISDAHKFTVRFTKTNNETWNAPNGNSCDDKFRNKGFNRASEQSQPFSGNQYSMMNNLMSISAELNSRFSNNVSNRFLATYTDINDQRGSTSSPFPHIDIMTGDTSSGNYIPYTSLGYELFTWNNGVLNKSLDIQDNVTIYAGAHTITAGASYQLMYARNSYMRNGTGYYRYASPEDFLNNALPLSFCLTYGYDGNENPAGVVNYSQYAAYVQDEWKITPKFKLMYGVRADLVAFNEDDIITNPNIADINYGGKHLDTGVWPKTRPQISPRLGFNWDVMGDKSLVVRGGTGLFQGRLPLVFFCNMPQNSGMIQGGVQYSATLQDGKPVYTPAVLAALQTLTAGGHFMTDVQEIVKTLGLPTSPSAESAGKGSQAYIGGVDPEFRMPQIWKTDIAIDYKVPTSFPFSITAEGMFNKTLFGVWMQDWSMDDSKLTSTFKGADNRVNYKACGAYTYDSTPAYILSNTTKGYGYTFNLTANLEPVKNLKIMAAYTHTESKEITGMPGSDGKSVYTGIPTVNGTNLTGLQRSRYVLPNKLMANISYFVPFKVFGGNGLHIDAYYTAYSSNGNSFIYSNDMNGDGNATDLIYIPKDVNDIAWKTPADGEAFMTFVNNDKYLSKHKGEYAEAYCGRAPWLHRLDLRIAEDFAFRIGNTTHNFQASVSIDNIGNMLNSSWGVTRLSCYQTSLGTDVAPLKYEGVNEAGVPSFSMIQVDGAYPTQNYTKYYEHTSQCWQILFGIKYFFN